MTINIESTSDSAEAVIAAKGDLASKPEVVVDDKNEVPAEVDLKPGEESEAEDVTEVIEVPIESDDESEELEVKENETKEKPKKVGGFQKKIAKLKQETEYWKAEALRSQSKPLDKVETVIAKDQTLRPKASDFATHDDYLEALIDHKADQKIQAIQAKRREEEVKSQIETKFNSYRERALAFKETHEDFDEAVESLQITPAINEAIVDSEHGPEMAYFLAQEPKELERIRSLPYGQAAREMGKLEVKFSKTTTSSVSTTKTPKPITPVRTRGTSTLKDISDPNLSQREYNRLREEQIKQNSLRR